MCKDIATTAFAFILAAVWLVYWPGLSGGFLFDDYANLPALGNFGPVDNAATFLRYITSGIADPTGRPLALLSFLIDASNWPAGPFSFKRTNVLLHMLNGLLLFFLLGKLGRISAAPPRQANLAALFGAGLWLLHPLWPSTVLYVVQREAMLPTTFTLLGIIGYLHGRQKSLTHPTKGAIWIFGTISITTFFAFISKANGILLPALILVVEYFFVRSVARHAVLPRRAALSLALATYPVTAATLLYLVYSGYCGIVFGVWPQRPWTLPERLLTEFRVLSEYVLLLAFPHPYSRGLLTDNYPVSYDIVHPWATLPAICLIAAIFVYSLLGRKKHPYISTALAFFLVGQSLESTTIPLELYFEHRNYLPSLLLFWPMAIWTYMGNALNRTKLFICPVLLLVFSTETYTATTLWGDPLKQALTWALKNPESPRAITNAANAERDANRFTEAQARLRMALKTFPDEIQIAVNLIGVDCQLGYVPDKDYAAAQSALRIGSLGGSMTFNWTEQAIEIVRSNSCDSFNIDRLRALITAAAVNPNSHGKPGVEQDMANLQGELALLSGDTGIATSWFLLGLSIDPKPDVALRLAALLGSSHHPTEGLEILNQYSTMQESAPPIKIRNMQSLHQWLLWHDGYWYGELGHIRGLLENDIKAEGLH